MSSSLEFYDNVSDNHPIKPVATKIHGVTGEELDQSDKHDLVLKDFHAYIADLCQKFNGGHPDSAMGMATTGVALYKYVVKFLPKNGNYFNRRRFVLSNGIYIHITIFKSQKRLGVEQKVSKTAYEYLGFHPFVMTPKTKDLIEEVKHDGIEILRGEFRGLNSALGIGFEH